MALLSAPPPAAGVGGSQNGGLRGRVVDPAGAPLAEVRITLSFLGGVNRTVSFESDERGTFVRMGIRLGEYRLEAARDGYRGHEETIRIRPGPPTRLGEIVLSPLRPAPGAPEAPAGSAELRAGRESLAAGDPEAAAAAFRVHAAIENGTESHNRGTAPIRAAQWRSIPRYTAPGNDLRRPAGRRSGVWYESGRLNSKTVELGHAAIENGTLRGPFKSA